MTDSPLLESIAITVVRIEERQKAHDKIHIEEAKVRIAEAAVLTKELDALNDVRTRFIPREVFEQRMGKVESFQSKMVGIGAAVIAVVGILGGLIGHALK